MTGKGSIDELLFNRKSIPWCACAATDNGVCLLVSHFSLVSGYITQYFEQLGFEKHGIDANKHGFLRVRFVVEKKRRKTIVYGIDKGNLGSRCLYIATYAHAGGAVSELRLAIVYSID